MEREGRLRRASRRRKRRRLENKIYLTMTMVEGDNIQYNQHRMRFDLG